LTTIHSIIDVAAARAYLDKVLGASRRRARDIPCENILSVVIPQIDLGGSPDGDPLGRSIPILQQVGL
jgi:hypothetical protein